MEYVKISENTGYKSWLQLEREAMRIISALEDHTYTIVITENEPTAGNVLFFSTSRFT